MTNSEDYKNKLILFVWFAGSKEIHSIVIQFAFGNPTGGYCQLVLLCIIVSLCNHCIIWTCFAFLMSVSNLFFRTLWNNEMKWNEMKWNEMKHTDKHPLKCFMLNYHHGVDPINLVTMAFHCPLTLSTQNYFACMDGIIFFIVIWHGKQSSSSVEINNLFIFGLLKRVRYQKKVMTQWV